MKFSFKIFFQRLSISAVAVFLPVALDQLKTGSFPDAKALTAAGVAAILAAAGIDYHAFAKAKEQEKKNRQLQWQESDN